ncbi:MAG: DUF1178 family protein [Pseudomonadota bacterium]
MIVFDLQCGRAHVFEAWFASSADYEDQRARHLLACPICGDGAIAKAVMAPHLGRKSNQKDSAEKLPVAGGDAREAAALLAKLERHVRGNFEDVGDRFPEEARKIHYGEAPTRGIYGEASAREAKALIEEGIDLLPLPDFKRKRKLDS